MSDPDDFESSELDQDGDGADYVCCPSCDSYTEASELPTQAVMVFRCALSAVTLRPMMNLLLVNNFAE